MHYKPPTRPQPLHQQLIRHPPGMKRPHKPRRPRLKDERVPQLLRNHTNTRLLLLTFITSTTAPQPTHIHARRHKRLNQRLIINTVARHHHIKTPTPGPRQRRRHLIRLPVQRRKPDPRPPGSGSGSFLPARPGPGPFTSLGTGHQSRFVLSHVQLHQLGHIGLVGQDVAGDARRQEQGDERGDAAAEFAGEGGWCEDVMGEEGVGWGGEPFCEEGGDFPED